MCIAGIKQWKSTTQQFVCRNETAIKSRFLCLREQPFDPKSWLIFFVMERFGLVIKHLCNVARRMRTGNVRACPYCKTIRHYRLNTIANAPRPARKLKLKKKNWDREKGGTQKWLLRLVSHFTALVSFLILKYEIRSLAFFNWQIKKKARLDLLHRTEECDWKPRRTKKWDIKKNGRLKIRFRYRMLIDRWKRTDKSKSKTRPIAISRASALGIRRLNERRFVCKCKHTFFWFITPF